MKKILMGIVIGVVLFALFLYFGGSEYVKDFGRKTEESGEKLEVYEKEFRESAEKAKETLVETGEKARETFDKSREKARETFDKAKETVKEYVPEDEEDEAEE
ncbi:MAG: hypothetical protein V3W31_08120 [Thermodesulfobacteriota bacterium]